MNRNLYTQNTCGQGEVVICGRFRPNGSGAIDNSLNIGLYPFTVTRIGVGAIELQLQGADTSYQVKVWGGQVQDSTPNGDYVQPTTESIAQDGKINIQILDATGAAVDLASSATTWVHVFVVLKNTRQTP